ncbi:MAG: porin [Balneolaceae bacterium]|nr:porin [Balneolaceae bacterium]
MLKRYKIGLSLCVIPLFLVLIASSPLNAQHKHDGSDFDVFQKQLKNDYFSVGALLQTRLDYQPERAVGNNGFSIGNARLQVYGQFDGGFGYQLQTNFTRQSAILDANAYYHFSDQFQIKAGLFKSPFSYEFLTGAPNLDFIGRSGVVNQLAPNRQVGVQVSGTSEDGILRYQLGAFNGNGFDPNQNTDENLLYVGRLEAGFETGEQASDDRIIFGLNASREIKEQPNSTGNIQSIFQGNQTLLGSDVRIIQGDLMLSGELIYSWLDSAVTDESYNPYGYHATIGYDVTSKTQLLARLDHFEGDNLVSNSESIVAGANIYPTSFSKIQVNYRIPTQESLDYSQVLVNFQIAI